MFEQEIAHLLAQHTPLDEKKIRQLIEIPPEPTLGDYAFPCFILAKDLRKAPQQIATELAETIQEDYIKHINAEGPYLNFFIKDDIYATTILAAQPHHQKTGKRVMVEYSQPNTHKQLHIGHLRNTVLGEATARLLEHTGDEVIRSTYPGDIGTHVAKTLYYYTTHKLDVPKENKGAFIGALYVTATQYLEEHPEEKENVSKLLQKLEAREEEITRIWNETREWSLDEFRNVYKHLGITFDRWYYESEEDGPGQKIVDELLTAGIAEKSQGAIIVDLEEEKLGIAPIRKSDGTTLYLTKDLSLGRKKIQEYNLDESIYVVDSRQSMHLKQAFRILQKMGVEGVCTHLAYEMVVGPDGPMSSRKGNVVLFDNYNTRVHNKIREELQNRHPDWSVEKHEEVIHAIMKGALCYGMLKVENNTEITYNEEQWLSLEGETGPYIQYTYARIHSIQKNVQSTSNVDYATLNTSEDKEILRLLAEEQHIQEEAKRQLKVHLITRYVQQLAQTTNTYYHKHSIKNADEKTKNARLHLLTRVAETLKRNCQIINVPLVEEM